MQRQWVKCTLTINSQLVPPGVQSLAHILTRETEYPSSFKSGSLGDILNQNVFFPQSTLWFTLIHFYLYNAVDPWTTRIWSMPIHLGHDLVTEQQIHLGGLFFFKVNTNYYRASLVAQMVKNLPAMWETCVWSLSQEDPLEKGMATHSSILAWRIPWTEEPGELQSMVLQRVKHDWAPNTHYYRILRWLSLQMQNLIMASRLSASIKASGKENIWGFSIHGGSQNQSPELPKGQLCSLKKQQSWN